MISLLKRTSMHSKTGLEYLMYAQQLSHARHDCHWMPRRSRKLPNPNTWGTGTSSIPLSSLPPSREYLSCEQHSQTRSVVRKCVLSTPFSAVPGISLSFRRKPFLLLFGVHVVAKCPECRAVSRNRQLLCRSWPSETPKDSRRKRIFSLGETRARKTERELEKGHEQAH